MTLHRHFHELQQFVGSRRSSHVQFPRTRGGGNATDSNTLLFSHRQATPMSRVEE